ncbi:hypothetical protein Arth_4426 (plasmid) [Arthrobacter sp. FB24]|uniref:hypothetical protein n=1 Tax=Arthrobacter sp. (strain FB24) TaxID=290399 RepID=UPI0000E5BEA8|nr:hypothetical protein [Arthrobacter sp. FB24]ABK05596.1 hypothetical protein Arth_4426 [Arthrobacter sp. FB24]
MLALRSHADQTTPGAAAATLSIVVICSLLGIFVADLLSLLTVHSRLPSGEELRHMIAFGVEGPGPGPAPAGRGRPRVHVTAVALGWAVGVLVVSLAVVGFLAIRRFEIPLHHKVVIMLAEVA